MAFVSELALRDVPYRNLVGTLQTIDKVAQHTGALKGYVTEEHAESPFRKREEGGIDPAQVTGGSPLPGLMRLSRLVAATERLEAFHPTMDDRKDAVAHEIERRREEAPTAYNVLKNLQRNGVGKGWLSTFADQADGYYPPQEEKSHTYANIGVVIRRPLSEPVLKALEWVAMTVPKDGIPQMAHHETQAQQHVLSRILGKLGREGNTERMLPRGQSLAVLYTVLSHLVLQRGAEGSFANPYEENLFQTLLGYSGAGQGNLPETTRQVRLVIERLFASEGSSPVIPTYTRRGGFILTQRSRSLVSTL